MITKTITYNKLEEGVRNAFTGDTKLPEFYDPHKSLTDIEDIIKDILRKISDFDGELSYRLVYEKNNVAGYFVYRKNLLISFGLNVKYRTRHLLKDFFRLIKSNIGSKFTCFLFVKNTRAIKWLVKNGLEVVRFNNIITELKCQ